MNTFKIFLNAYKPSLYMALMPIGLFIVITILQVIIPSAHDRIYNIAWLLYFFPFTILPNVFSRLYEKKPLYLLPTSRRTKFFMPLGIAFLIIIATCLLTIPIEAVVHLFTMSNAPEQQIVIGGFLKCGFTHNTPIFISLVIACASVFLHSLVQNKIIIPCIVFASVFAITTYAPQWMEYMIFSPAMSTNAIIGCLASSALLIAASYQLFKRWQPANDGIFRI